MATEGYERLHVYQIAHKLAVEIHAMTLTLPKYEMYEEGSQIRRSSKRVSASIVEGYALRQYKAEFIQYLLRAYGSAEETVEHLDLLNETGSLNNLPLYTALKDKATQLNRQLLRFIQGVQQQHEKPNAFREEQAEYLVNNEIQLSNLIENPSFLQDAPIDSSSIPELQNQKPGILDEH